MVKPKLRMSVVATPVVQPSGADQAAVTLENVEGEIGGLTISDPPTQAEVQALRNKCEEFADDVRACWSGLAPISFAACLLSCAIGACDISASQHQKDPRGNDKERQNHRDPGSLFRRSMKMKS